MGIIYSDEGDLERALRIHHERLAISKKEGRKGDVVESLCEIGVVQKKLSNHREAQESYEEGLALAREMKALPAVAVSLHQIGVIRLELKDYEGARKFLREAATLLEEMEDPQLPVTLVRISMKYLGMSIKKFKFLVYKDF